MRAALAIREGSEPTAIAGAHRDRVGRGRRGRPVRRRDDGDRRRDERGRAARAAGRTRRDRRSAQTSTEQVRDLVEAEPIGDLTLRGHESRGGRLARARGCRGRWPSTRSARTRGAAHRSRRGAGRSPRTPPPRPTASARPRCSRSSACRAWARAGSRARPPSRLAADGWTVVRGRCLPYGEGITYWPMAEIVRELAGIDADTAPDEALDRCAAQPRRRTSPTAWRWPSASRKPAEDGAAERRRQGDRLGASAGWSSRSPRNAARARSSRTSTGRSRPCST